MEINLENERVRCALENKNSGNYKCAQTVACAFADVAGVDEDVLYRLTGAYGTGMGCLEGTCGALVGAGMVLGAVSKDRIEAMKRMKVVMDGFYSRNGATVCKYLKGIETGQPLRPCIGCVADAAELLCDVIK